MNQNKEDTIFVHRILELEHRCHQGGYPCFSDFMNLHEYQLFLSAVNEFHSDVHYALSGGYQDAERKIVGFYPDYMDITEVDFPFSRIHISPQHLHFAEDLTHRDYLGAILNLGIDRCKTGDILIDHSDAFLFSTKNIASFILENLQKVKHTNVKVELVDNMTLHYSPKKERISGTVSSLRLDVILSIALKGSRSSCSKWIGEQIVYCNNELITSPSYRPQDKDIISVRGHGRFQLDLSETRETKKGKLLLHILKYI